MADSRPKWLFVCSRNKWRSPTAERLFARSPLVQVRGRGLSASAVRRLSAEDISWADVIFVMEHGHKQQLYRRFRDQLGDRPVHVLDIPDDYQFMGPDLIELLRSGVTAAVGDVLDGAER